MPSEIAMEVRPNPPALVASLEMAEDTNLQGKSYGAQLKGITIKSPEFNNH